MKYKIHFKALDVDNSRMRDKEYSRAKLMKEFGKLGYELLHETNEELFLYKNDLEEAELFTLNLWTAEAMKHVGVYDEEKHYFDDHDWSMMSDAEVQLLDMLDFELFEPFAEATDQDLGDWV